MKEPSQIGIVELIDRTLNKGVLLNADVVITVAEVPLLAANLRLALASVETMLKYGMMNDWLKPVSLPAEKMLELPENQEKPLEKIELKLQT